MTRPAGGFIWYELMTTDPDAAAAFYGPVVGWKIGANAMPGGDMDYRMIERGDGGYAGGVLALTGQMTAGGARPAWMGYLHVEDVDAEVAAITAEGGQVHMPPITMAGVGRMAMVADPQGAPVYLMAPRPPEGREDMESDVFSPDKARHVRWNELMTTNQDAAIAFYRKHFGWTQEGGMPMGELGTYAFVQHDGLGIGAIMPLMPDMPASVWSYYIGVDDIDRAAAAIGAEGGSIVNGPMEIPGGEFALNALDPQGAAFGLVGPRGG